MGRRVWKQNEIHYAYKNEITIGRQIPANFFKPVFHASQGRLEEKQNKFLFPNRASDAIGARHRHQGKDPARSQKERDQSMKRQASAWFELGRF
jgi:hypothetical protein